MAKNLEDQARDADAYCKMAAVLRLSFPNTYDITGKKNDEARELDSQPGNAHKKTGKCEGSPRPMLN